MAQHAKKNPAAVALGRTGGKKDGPARAAKGSDVAALVAPVLDTSRKALHSCLKRIKDAQNENELHRLTEELQRIVFHSTR